MGKEIIVKKLNLTTLSIYLNENFKKKSGGKFTVGDVQGYVSRGYLPKYLGDVDIKKDNSITSVNLYNLVKNEK